ncbi:MAG: nitrate reductase associated protein [Candidatus Binatia bacterium]
MFHRFRYEAESYPTLSRIPLHVRMKLDVTGLKISLKDWLACSFEDRSALCHLPIEGAEEKETFAAYVDFLSRRDKGQPVEVTDVLDSVLWDEADVPAPVAQKSASCFNTVTIEEWRGWQSYQRYALYKTAISKSQPEAFADVLDELRASSKLAAEN